MTEPRWLTYARAQVGIREIVGVRQEPRILAMWRRIGRWAGIDVATDEVPWCGAFVADCLLTGANIKPVSISARAKAWANWGLPCEPIVGAIAVLGRQGGGHVGFVTGETSTHLRILGGNQSNAVNEMMLAKSRLVGCRWPSGEPQTTRRRWLAGASAPVSENEA